MGVIGKIFSPPKPQTQMPIYVPVQQVVQPPTDYEAQAAAEEAEKKQRKAATLAKGAASNILTGGLGLTDSAPVSRKQLFGE